MEPLKKFFTIVGELGAGIFQPRNSFLFSRSLLFWVIVLSVILIPFFARFISNITSPENEVQLLRKPDSLLAEVGDLKIYKTDVEKLALETYSKDAIDEKVLKTYLNILIERSVMDLEAINLGIVVAETEINDVIIAEGEQDTEKVRSKVFYKLLKQKLMGQIISSRTAHVVEYWTPAKINPEIETDTDNPLYETQRAQGKEALTLIEQKLLRDGGDILDATRTVLAQNNFKELEEIIAVNGLRLSKVTNEVELRKPYTFTTKDQEVMGVEFFEALFSMQTGDVKTIFREGNSAGKLYQVINSSQGNYSTYEQWLSNRGQELVKIKVNL